MNMRCCATALAIAALAGVTACGGGSKQHAVSAAGPPSGAGHDHDHAGGHLDARDQPQAQPRPGARPPAPPRCGSAAPYTCDGKPLRAIAADGPVKVEPAIVKPGQSFTVTVTDPGARVADVTLAGVARPADHRPRRAEGRRAWRRVIRMPAYATCGNKLLEVEGDISAEAYVGVSR